mmetsp:Transcript_3568/g.8130  ORF Transcript_3568/g.8130 Transcript_3568/m.8130 type:complete len:281 (+) Transcript_3568:720-1562(+)
MTVPDAAPTALLMKILESLQRCALFLSKKFKSGEPCGDTLEAIVEGKDGSLVAVPSIIQRLKTIYSLVKVMDSSQYKEPRECNHCGKSDQDFQNSYMICSRCKRKFYCSKDCQRADWALHKNTCQPPTKDKPYSKFSAAMVTNWLQQHFVETAIKMAEECDKHKLEMEDMVTEIDFMPTKDGGAAPAMRSPPVFKIAPRRNYLNRSEKPDWLCNKQYDDPANYERDTRLVIDDLKEKERFATKTGLLLVNYPNDYFMTMPNLAKEEWYHNAYDEYVQVGN